MHLRIALLVACAVPVVPCAAQTRSMSRAEVIEAALARGARIGVARADTAVAAAQVAAARAVPNPTFLATYSKSIPTYHYVVELPVDFPWIRQLRIRSAELGRDAASLRYQLARATVGLDADTTYTRAVAAGERLTLSRRNALDADSVLHMVQRRRDAGDASEMDVELARVFAGQQANIANADSLFQISTLLDLQGVLGMTTERLEIATADTLGTPPQVPALGRTISEIAADVTVESATLSSRLQRRSILSLPAISFGFETGDPDQRGLLPTFGVGIALPLFDRNRGGIAQADAERAHAIAEANLARVEARNLIAHAVRVREIEAARVARSRSLLVSAEHVASMSLTAYREGLSTLANVLEARRTAREVMAQYIDDLATVWVSTAQLRVLALQPLATR
jgi:outer membrane protein, heavy metal efflux system